MVVVGRFVPGGTMAVGVSAGLFAYSVSRFLVFSMLGALLWTAYDVALGLLGRAAYSDSSGTGAAMAVAVALGAGVAVHAVSLLWRRRRVR